MAKFIINVLSLGINKFSNRKEVFGYCAALRGVTVADADGNDAPCSGKVNVEVDDTTNALVVAESGSNKQVVVEIEIDGPVVVAGSSKAKDAKGQPVVINDLEAYNARIKSNVSSATVTSFVKRTRVIG